MGPAVAACLLAGVLAAPTPLQADEFNSRVRIDNGTRLDAGAGASATSRIGGGNVDIGGPGITNHATPGNRADISVGTPDGNVRVRRGIHNQDGQQHLGGNTTIGGKTYTGDGARLGVGGTGSSVYVGDDVYVPSGSLKIGGMGQCVAFRNNRCCVDVHWGTCVLNIVPPGKHGCPPRYTYTGGVCRLFYDLGGHRIEGY